MKPTVITALFIGFAVLITVVYDLLALFVWGSESTISAVINVWAYESHPLINFCFGMVFGGLIVHFLAWKPVNK